MHTLTIEKSSPAGNGNAGGFPFFLEFFSGSGILEYIEIVVRGCPG